MGIKENIVRSIRKHTGENEFPIYVPSKGRSNISKTTKLLDEAALNYFIVVEPQDEADYKLNYNKNSILVIPENNMGIAYVRSFCKSDSIKRGAKYHFQLDDNINNILLKDTDEKYKRHCICKTINTMSDIVTQYKNIGGVGLASDVFKFGYKYPFKLNKNIYSFCIFNNSTSSNWEKDIVEDTDYALQMLFNGYVTVLLMDIVIKKETTMKLKGGNTEISYSNNGREIRSNSLMKKYPGFFTTRLDNAGNLKIKPSRIWRQFTQEPNNINNSVFMEK